MVPPLRGPSNPATVSASTSGSEGHGRSAKAEADAVVAPFAHSGGSAGLQPPAVGPTERADTAGAEAAIASIVSYGRDLRGRLAQVQHEIDEYIRLQELIHSHVTGAIKTPMNTLVHLGHSVYAHGEIERLDFVSVRVGAPDYFLEMTCNEAIEFIPQRLEHLRSQEKRLAVAVSRESAHITRLRGLLDQLSLLDSLSAGPGGRGA